MTGECYQVGFHIARYLPFDRRGVTFLAPDALDTPSLVVLLIYC